MGTTDLAIWGFDPALLLTPSHHKWTAAITFSRRYKLRGFPDLTASPVVALCSIELTGGNPAAVDVRVLRRVTDAESTGIEQKLLEELASREPAVDAIAHSDSLGPRWCGTRFWWCVPDPSQRPDRERAGILAHPVLPPEDADLTQRATRRQSVTSSDLRTDLRRATVRRVNQKVSARAGP